MRRVKQGAVVFVLVFAAAQLIRPERANPATDVGRTIQAQAGTSTALAAVLDRSCFALSATILTVLASLFLFAPNTVLYWEFPCLSDVFDAHQGELASLSVSTLAAGSHLTALATATWLATAHSRNNRTATAGDHPRQQRVCEPRVPLAGAADRVARRLELHDLSCPDSFCPAACRVGDICSGR